MDVVFLFGVTCFWRLHQMNEWNEETKSYADTILHTAYHIAIDENPRILYLGKHLT